MFWKILVKKIGKYGKSNGKFWKIMIKKYWKVMESFGKS